MKLVELVHIEFSRIGSGSSYSFPQHRSASVTHEREASVDIFEIVKEAAKDQALQSLQQVDAGWQYTNRRGAAVFNIRTPNVMYGDPYAICWTEPALKINDRYFRLDEVFK